MSIAERKQQMRELMRKKRDALAEEIKTTYDKAICEKIAQLIDSQKAQTIHCYLPMGSEIDIKPLIKTLLVDGKTIICPKTLKNRKLEHLQLHSLIAVEEGLWGTKHPKGEHHFSGELDLIIVPGLAFDENNYRLGYGGGYYDSFLAKHSNATKIGLCYPFQLVKDVPRETHDVQLDDVLVVH